jgi:hydrogenase expression/formation protein HypE
MTRDLIRDLFLPRLGTSELAELDDAALVSSLLFTTDSFVVDPVFFPGGDIGKLSVFGTLNDLWVSGARPLFLSAGFIIEEGAAMDDLASIAESMSLAAASAGVRIVAGDTKVVPRGKADKVFINTSGIGALLEERRGPRRAVPGDRVLVSGTVGEHGLVILAHRLKLPLGSLVSDCGPVGPDIDRLFQAGADVHMMRDPTRGGLATVLAEVAERSSCDVLLRETDVPVRQDVREIADILGVDPLYLPCEGRVVAFAAPGPVATGWAEIGAVTEGQGGVYLETRYGGHRRLSLFEGTPLPRIC